MANMFQEVLSDAQGMEQKLLGPSYPYYKNINNPQQLGMSDNGTISQLGTNINGMIQYVGLLVSGSSSASATGQPLGNKFFLQTGAKCKDVASGNQTDRYIYVNNVPTGNIPFISSGLGTDFSDFKGLIPGAMGNLNVLNPFAIMQSFLSGSTPDCQELTMQTIDINNNKSSETHYVTLVDIQNMDPCTFQNGKNPVNGKSCNETFQTKESIADNASPFLPEDPLAQLYFFSLSMVGIYVLYRLMEKSR
jgi:hypothetical protein